MYNEDILLYILSVYPVELAKRQTNLIRYSFSKIMTTT